MKRGIIWGLREYIRELRIEVLRLKIGNLRLDINIKVVKNV